MRQPKVPEQRPSLLLRLLRVVWVVSLTGFGLVGGVYWIGKSYCPTPCQFDDRQAQAQTQPQQSARPASSQALGAKPKAVR